MSDGEALARMIVEAGRPKLDEVVDIEIGEVTSLEPLKIRFTKELSATFLILSPFCYEKVVTLPEHVHNVPAVQTGTAGDPSHSHSVPQVTSGGALPTITLWRGLAVGDSVYALKCARGQKYYILQRVEGATQ